MSWNKRNDHNNTHGATIKQKGSTVTANIVILTSVDTQQEDRSLTAPSGTKLPAIHVFTPTAHSPQPTVWLTQPLVQQAQQTQHDGGPRCL